MTHSTTSGKRRRQSSQGGDNLDMAGDSEMEGSRCNVIIKNMQLCNLKYYQQHHYIYTL
jgi:hypothetical protein